MADETTQLENKTKSGDIEAAPEGQSQPSGSTQLERSTYEIIQNRLASHSNELQTRLHRLNEARREVFGSIPTELIATDRVTTENNCVAQDMVEVGENFIFGYNVRVGLRSTTKMSDVFAVYRLEDNHFHEQSLELLSDPNFEHDFSQLYKYYKETSFSKFQQIGPYLFFVFQVGKSATDVKSFKFTVTDEGLKYFDNRSDHELKFPDQHEFRWVRTHRDQHRQGKHPHISIEDRLFVETIGGDLTIKIEDNTSDGQGIYSEPVEDVDQTLDDAEVLYSIVGNLIILKMRPFREDKFRYLVYNEKVQSVTRLDAIEDACVLLPEDHGLIFSKGYYLQSGMHKTFENDLEDLLFEQRIDSGNGEDFLYVFYTRKSGHYVLLAYNMIERVVGTPIICDGYSLFDNGHLLYFKSEDTPQKHHTIQIWQTPFVDADYQTETKTDSFLFKIGNRDIVRAMAECNEIISLIGKDDSYQNLYVDLLKKSTDVIDTYFWLADEKTHNLAEALRNIQESATAAVDEFDKVVRVRRATNEAFKKAKSEADEAVTQSAARMYRTIDEYVKSLSDLRLVRGQVISLKELKYIDLKVVSALETKIIEQTDRLSHRCVQFLLGDDALKPYHQKVDQQNDSIDEIATVAQGKELESAIDDTANELEMLIDIVSNLKIDDATHRTQIIDNVSVIYSSLNQTRAGLKKKVQELMSVEGAAEFNSQLKLLGQAVVNYLDVCDSPQKCDEFLTKMMVQIEELEGRFSEFDEFIVQLAEKREEVYAAFDNKKLQLIEARNRRATALMNSADRILKGIASKLQTFETQDEINSYFAADLMVDKVRDIIDKLGELEESVKVDDVQSRLKTVREDATRQLRDKKELFVDGQAIIQFGKHKFSVNTQPLDLTTVLKNDWWYFHLSGTNFFEQIADEQLGATRAVWSQNIESENSEVYRAEYLAHTILIEAESNDEFSLESIDEMERETLDAFVQKFMAPRYSEGYVKGVHDNDASLILQQLVKLHSKLGQLRYSPADRALALIAWKNFQETESKADSRRLLEKVRVAASAESVFKTNINRQRYLDQLSKVVNDFVEQNEIGETAQCARAANYLFDFIADEGTIRCSQVAGELVEQFRQDVDRAGGTKQFESSKSKVLSTAARYLVTIEWLEAFAESASLETSDEHIHEAAMLLVYDHRYETTRVASTEEVTGMLGDHIRLDGKKYRLNYHDFMNRVDRFKRFTLPAYRQYVTLKKELTDTRRAELRLEEFKPRVLTSFVRNKLINDVYLPMVGANLAKQIGEIGEEKRTDLMGLLLLISPPGYGKTTLMEYLANRLGLTFMKINGPAIGHQVTSLDPTEAPNASAREEVEKLNLALEMGDNVMIYLDDIQHCNPEFLQKFISLCDATRRIEGVFKGQTRTYDLRGRKVCVVMAGNPYTESGEKFQIPDMLANRADTYNLGDVIGDRAEAFELSYLENCITSNPTLARLNSRSRTDIYSIIDMAKSDEPPGTSLEGNYSIEEINEFVSVMRKLIAIREVVLQVNRLYIDSAAQAEDYRTEPPFKLQGSYRDMNKMAEQVNPIMNDQELQVLINAHFENQAQTLTTGAEANLLKFKDLTGQATDEEATRWSEIKRTFKRNLMLGNVAGDDKFGQVIAQMSTFADGLSDIRTAVEAGVKKMVEAPDESDNAIQVETLQGIGSAVSELAKFNESLDGIKALLDQHAERSSQQSIETAKAIQAALSESKQTEDDKSREPMRIQVVNRVPHTFLDVLRNQFRVLQTWMDPILALAEVMPEAKELQKAARATRKNYKQIMKKIGESEQKELEEIIDAEIIDDE